MMYTGYTTTVLQPLYGSPCKLEDFVRAKFYCPQALADGNQHMLCVMLYIHN